MQGFEKSSLREHFSRLRQAYPPEQATADSARIRKKLLGLEKVRTAQAILLYLAAKGEVDTWSLVDHFLAKKRRVLAPYCSTGKPGHMEVRQIHTRDDLVPGPFGLMEPRPDAPLYTLFPDIILVPGLAFDRQGFRLGFGGGYYDRFLGTANRSGLAIGLAYDFQITDTLPTNLWDCPVDMVLTPKSTIVRHAKEDA